MSPLSLLSPRKLLSWPTSRFLGLNVVLAVLVLVAHGGALVVGAQVDHPGAKEVRSLALLSVPIAALVIVGSIFARLRPTGTAFVLKGQSLAGLLLALYLVVWAVQLLLADALPPRFMWTPGFLTAIVYYSAVMLVAHVGRGRMRSGSRHAIPAVAALLAAVLDLGVLVKSLQ